ncbi:MAG: bis(5'-nucleosyl)-tetraphosphatase (symmetrical) YqeK [Clostridiales bacterium]|nr:bis(5'-nucleosyl)-tetraphosphatase (symmetrical) YqeK [Clostridiales bacterium]
MELDELRNEMTRVLSSKRAKHALGCESEAEKLALRWGADPYKARQAAILHDITKERNREEQLKLCEKYSIMLGDVEKLEWPLLHALTAAEIARSVYHVSGDICEAVRYHTTGKENMTLLQKIIYLADFIEPTRTFRGVCKLRKLAYKNINEALLFAFDSSIKEVLNRGGILHPDTVNGRNWICTKGRD